MDLLDQAVTMDPFVRFPTNKAIPRMPIPGKSIGIDLNTTIAENHRKFIHLKSRPKLPYA
jgi:hypothetical protein